MLDMLIKNVEVFDGTGTPSMVRNVGVLDGKIVHISDNDTLQAVVEIDGSNLSLAPGFIDSHAHSDTHLYLNLSRWEKLKQGVTTEVGGQCGWSPAPFPKKAPRSKNNRILKPLARLWTT